MKNDYQLALDLKFSEPQQVNKWTTWLTQCIETKLASENKNFCVKNYQEFITNCWKPVEKEIFAWTNLPNVQRAAKKWRRVPCPNGMQSDKENLEMHALWRLKLSKLLEKVGWALYTD